MLFPGPVKGRIVRKAAVIADCRQSPSLGNEAAGFLQSFGRNVMAEGKARLALKEVHEVIGTEKTIAGDDRDGQFLGQVAVNIRQDELDFLILPAITGTADFFLLHRQGQVNEKF